MNLEIWIVISATRSSLVMGLFVCVLKMSSVRTSFEAVYPGHCEMLKSNGRGGGSVNTNIDSPIDLLQPILREGVLECEVQAALVRGEIQF
jgi:hypothetical protein